MNLTPREKDKLVCCPRNSLSRRNPVFVIPAKAGIQCFACIFLDSGSRGAVARSARMTS